MIKISNELKIGVVAIITIVIFIWLFNFLKGKNFFKSTVSYYAVYNEIGGLGESSPVEINGYKVGVVQSIDFLDKESGLLLVEFSVSKGFNLPVNTIAEITPLSLIAGMKVQFLYGEGPGTYSPGDTIPGRLALTIITKLENELVPVKEKLMNLIDAIDSITGSVNDIMDDDFKKNLGGTMSNLNNITGNMDDIIGTQEKELKATLASISVFTQMLSENSAKMGNTLSNLESITDTLAASDISTTVLNLKNSLEKTSLLLENLNDGKGTAGQFLTNDSLYKNLNGSLQSLNLLLEDMKANPKRYVHFSIFGKKSEPTK
jgi:phospholipid/cholesterol/gamma-HCH transport system substrate-binding protein